MSNDKRSLGNTGVQLLLAAVFFCSGALYAQAAGKPAVNYTVMPKLQELKDHPPAPDFVLPDPAGRKVALKDFRGKVVLLGFWATWCEFCREELPALQQLYQEFKGKGLEIVAVNIKDKRNDALAFVRKQKLSYPILMDPEGDIGLLYGAYATPTVYLIDRKGVVLARQWGPAGWYSPAARNLIKSLVEQ